MEELTAQVKRELFRTLIWLVIAISISVGIYYLLW